MKDDGTLALDGTVTPIMRLLLQRRSHRKHGPGPVDPVRIQHVLVPVLAFLQGVRFASPRIEILDEGPAFDRVLAAATGGLIGRLNPWLRFTEARHLLLCGTVYPADHDVAGVELALKQAAMAMEVAVLAATAAGLATCWLTAIDHAAVETARPLPDGARLVAISPLGWPAPDASFSLDAVVHQLVSRHRRPLETLWTPELWRSDP